MHFNICLWILVSVCFILCSCHSLNQTRELLHDVLNNYDKRIRPTLNQSNPTVVNLQFFLLNIAEVDEVKSLFAVSGILAITWKDELIRWDPRTNNGISRLNIPLTDVWYPVLVLVYGHGKTTPPVQDWMNVLMFNSGDALLTPGDIYRATCKADITYFPFDVQECSLIFNTWGYLEHDINLTSTLEYVLDTFFIEHGEWEIIDNASIPHYPTSETVSFKLVVRRKPMFYVLSIIIPIILMSLLNVLVFVLPPQSGERISFSITVLLAIAVFLTMIGDHLPKTSKPMSFLSYFLMISLSMSALICVLAVINLCIYFKDDGEHFPVWAKVVLMLTTCSKPHGSGRYKVGINAENSTPDRAQTNAHIPDESKDSSAVSWADVSRSIDKLCITFFLCVTVLSSVGFLVIVTNQ